MTANYPESPPGSMSTALDSAHLYRAHWERMREATRLHEEEEARAEAERMKERLINLKMPNHMIDRLDQIARDAGTNRSQLIRQILADFLNHIWTQGIRFRGSTLGFRHRPIEDGLNG